MAPPRSQRCVTNRHRSTRTKIQCIISEVNGNFALRVKREMCDGAKWKALRMLCGAGEDACCNSVLRTGWRFFLVFYIEAVLDSRNNTYNYMRLPSYRPTHVTRIRTAHAILPRTESWLIYSYCFLMNETRIHNSNIYFNCCVRVRCCVCRLSCPKYWRKPNCQKLSQRMFMIVSPSRTARN